MARARRFEIDELLVRPGTYFNPQTEVLIVVDDTPEVDQATLESDSGGDEGEWVLVSDEAPIDEAARDELLERFQATYREGARGRDDAELDEADDEDFEDEDEELEPDPDPDEL
ncbi:MAG: hypothetical protein JSS99_16540 [Actinobacteria bacterium]|nr:hypothetical protein [Actinomycetota bacterium]